MATFTNTATLTYNGTVTTSNTTVGELLEVLSVTKTAVRDRYSANNDITYVVSITNSGTTALNGLTLTDNLGAYTVGTTEVVPLTYTTDSIRYYVNGELRPAPTTTGTDELTVTGINLPAGGNAIIVYEVQPNSFAPQAVGGTINNTATVTGAGITEAATANETVTVADEAVLDISKTLSPTTVTENGQLTYTFNITNLGNTATTATDDVVLTDIFNPILNPISVTFNGTPWTEGVNYTYNETTGEFNTLAGQITVPAATFTQDPATGVITRTPGTSTLTVTGTV